jgi:hypothetical protein
LPIEFVKNLSKQNLLENSIFFGIDRFIQVKLTKTSYIETLFIYTGFQFILDFSLLRVQFIQCSVYSGFQFIQDSGLFRIPVYSGFSLFSVQFIQDSSLFRISVYSGFSLFRVQFIQGSV